MSGWVSAIGPAGFLRGWTVTWSAPTPTRFTSLVMVSALLPRTPLPSTYVPAQTATVSPGRAASIADWMVWKCGAGQPSPTDSVAGGPAAFACPLVAATAIAIPSAAADATHFSFRPFISISAQHATIRCGKPERSAGRSARTSNDFGICARRLVQTGHGPRAWHLLLRWNNHLAADFRRFQRGSGERQPARPRWGRLTGYGRGRARPGSANARS